MDPKLSHLVEVGDRRVEVVLGKGPRGILALVDGSSWEVDLAPLPEQPGAFSLLLDGASHEVFLEDAAGCEVLWLDGVPWPVRVLDPRQRLAAPGNARRPGPRGLTSPMAGIAVEVRVRPGDAVTPGQTAVVLEAMKMRNALGLEAEGIVKAVHVKPGSTVAPGQLLVELE